MICRLCPRECGVDRSAFRGFCGMGEAPRLARAALHQWEEPCISGDPDDSGQTGSGTVFFSGCVMRCVFCQNHDVSAGGFGKDVTVSCRMIVRFQEEKLLLEAEDTLISVGGLGISPRQALTAFEVKES